MDISSTSDLLSKRSVQIMGPITEESATNCIAQMLFLHHNSSSLPISLQIDSPGGNVTASIAIIRTIDDLHCPICTYCIRQAGGTALVIAAHGTRGFRSASPATLFCFAPTFGEHGRAYVEAEISQFDQALVELLAEDTVRHEQEMHTLFQAGYQMAAPEAVNFGLIDRISDTPITPAAQPIQGGIKRLRRVIGR